MYRSPGDPYGTIYPGWDIPDEILKELGIKNTRRDGTWSKYVWAQFFLYNVLRFINMNKGRIMSKGLPFTMALIHPDNADFWGFQQDMYYHPRSQTRFVPHRREHFMKSRTKVVADALFAFKCDKEGWYKGTKIFDPNGRYAISTIRFHKSFIGDDLSHHHHHPDEGIVVDPGQKEIMIAPY